MTQKTMTIGTTLKGEPFRLPTDTVTSTLVTFGGKGMGKTNLGSVIVEELTRMRQRWSWLDPIGVSWGLRHSADGKGKGVECLILGGVHGDIPIEPSGGAAVADVVIDESVNVLIDFSRTASGEMWGPTEKVRFCTAYMRQLFRRQGELKNGRRREPMFQALDEAARYIPQIIPHGNPELAACVSAWEQAVEEGRNIGLGIGLWTLRSARLNKSVSELADALFAFRTVGPNSLEAITDWLGQHADRAHVKSLAAQVRALDQGTALVVSPGWMRTEQIVKMRLRETFDSSATPKAGERGRRVRGSGAKPDLASIRERMKQTIEAAKANDPKELKKRLADVEAELKVVKAKREPKPQPVKTVTVKVPMLTDAQIKRLERTAQKFEDAITKHRETAQSLLLTVSGSVVDIKESVKDALKAAAVPLEISGHIPAAKSEAINNRDDLRREQHRQPPTAANTGAPSAVDADSALGKGERIVLTAIAQYREGMSPSQLTILTGYKETSRRTYLQRLSRRGFITTNGDTYSPTKTGLQALGDYEPLPTGPALRDYWLRKLGGGEQMLLKIVVEAHPREITKAQISEKTGYKDTSLRTYLQRLGARKLITVTGNNVKASLELFE